MKNESSIYSRYFTYIKPITRLPIVRTYGSTIFTLLIIVIFIFFAIKPTIETILVLQKKLEDSNLVLEQVNQKATNLSLGKKNYDDLDPGIKDKIQQAIPDQVELKSLVQTLEQAASVYDASISAIQIQPLVIQVKDSDTIGKISEVRFTFNLEGEYKNLILLLQDLKSSARLISIETLSMSKASEGSGLIMSVGGKTFYVK